MLTKRQNMLETVRGGKPDRYVNQYEAPASLSSATISWKSRIAWSSSMKSQSICMSWLTT